MNKVFNENGEDITVRGDKLVYAMGFNSEKYKNKISSDEARARIQGKGHCDCFGYGTFDLLPVNHPAVQDGLKRYMVCRKCGCWSHL